MSEEMSKYFGGSDMEPPRQDVVATTGSAGAVAEIQGRMVIAKKFPRDQRKAFDAIMNACQRPSLAQAALYEYSRGGTPITGPSIRMAEAMAQNWGNIDFGIRELDQQGGESVVEAFAWDMETNVRQTKTFRVPHKRYTKKGSYSLEDPRDIYEMVANNGARRLRACILGVIPGDVVDAAVAECEKTMHASADTSEKGVKKMVDAFATEFGITREQLEGRIQRRLDAITPAQVVALRKIYTSLKDGMSAAGDWFEAPAKADDAKAGKKGVDALKDAIAKPKDGELV